MLEMTKLIPQLLRHYQVCIKASSRDAFLFVCGTTVHAYLMFADSSCTRDSSRSQAQI
jgi:hypothetical protein